MASRSSGSAVAVSAKSTWPGCRNAALSSRVTLPSRATTWPDAVFTSGFTSTRLASSVWKTSHRVTRMAAIWSATSAGKPAAATISCALEGVTPVSASTGTLASASGRSTASCSISTPPSLEAIAR